MILLTVFASCFGLAFLVLAVFAVVAFHSDDVDTSMMGAGIIAGLAVGALTTGLCIGAAIKYREQPEIVMTAPASVVEKLTCP